MKFSIHINQKQALELGLININQAVIFDLLTGLSTWASTEVIDGDVFYWVSRQRIAKELPILGLKDDTIYRHLKALSKIGLIEHKKLGKKDCIRVTEKGKKYYVGNKSELDASTMSEINPNHYVGNESENNSEINPTYKTTNEISLKEDQEAAVRVAHYLHEKLTKEIPEIKANPQSWITEIERAIRIDGRAEQDLIAIIDWMHKGDKFWVANIQSGKKLREKYNTMIAQKRQQQPAKEAAPASQRTFAENQRIADEVEKQQEAARQATQPRNVTPIRRNRPVSLKQVLADAKRGSK